MVQGGAVTPRSELLLIIILAAMTTPAEGKDLSQLLLCDDPYYYYYYHYHYYDYNFCGIILSISNILLHLPCE